MRAKMRASLPDSHSLNGLTANRAGFAGLLIHLKVILEVSAPIDPVDAGAVVFNALRQRSADRFQQPGSFQLAERVTRLPGMNAG